MCFPGFRKTGVLAWSGRAAGGLSAVREGHSVFCRLGRVEGHAAQDALAFFDENDLIRVDILECFNKPARPADFEQLDFFRFSDSKMHAQIVLRKIPAAAAHFVDLRMLMLIFGRMRHALDARPNAAAVRFCPDGLDLDPIATCRGITAQKLDRKSTRLNSSHVSISYAVFCLKKKI